MGKNKRDKGYLVVTKEILEKMKKYEAYRKVSQKYFVIEDIESKR